MKNKISKLILCGVMFAFASCNLDRYPESSIGEDDFYSSATEVEYGLIGAYAYLQDAYENFWRLSELRSDNTQAHNGGLGGTSLAADDARFSYSYITDTNTTMTECWDELYVLVGRCNAVLQYVDVVDDEAARNKMKAELLALRAMVHFDITRIWGEVWYVDSYISGAEALAMSKTSQTEILEKIVEDLEWAVDEGGLPTPDEQPSDEIGRLNDYAVRTLLAKVYLTQKEYAKVKTVLDPVIADYGTSDLVAYADIFSTNNEMNKEIFFAIRYMSGNLGLGSPYTNLFGPTAVLTFNFGACSGRNAPTDDICRAFGTTYEWDITYDELTDDDGNILYEDDGVTPLYDYDTELTYTDYNSIDPETIVYTEDLRFNVCIRLDDWSESAPTNVWYTEKYMDYNSTTASDADADFPLIRYADALLMYAEALNRTGSTSSANTYVNAIRNRAGLSDVNITDSDDMHTEILLQRRLEFYGENQRLFDMLREDDGSGTYTYFIDRVNEVFYNDEVYQNYQDAYEPELLAPLTTDWVSENRVFIVIPFSTSSLY